MKLFFCGVSAGFYRSREAPAAGNGLSPAGAYASPSRLPALFSGNVQYAGPSQLFHPSPTQNSRSADMRGTAVRTRKERPV